MPARDVPLTGDALLAAVTDAMVALHERYHHRAPVTAKTLLLGGDLLACVMGGVYTDVEKTMIELQRTTIVQETRSAFQDAMQHKFIAAVERLSGRACSRSSPTTTSDPTWRSSCSCSGRTNRDAPSPHLREDPVGQRQHRPRSSSRKPNAR